MTVSDLENLIDEHGKAIYSFCYKLTLAQSDTDDLYQQTFLKALELRDQIDPNQNPKSLLFSIAISLWKNSKRKSARRWRIAPTISTEDLQYEEVASSLNIEASEKLNQDLKRTLRTQAAKQSTFSLWWLPLVLSTLFTVGLCLPVLYMGTATVIQFLMIAFSAVSTLGTFLLTLISFIKFNLKEGALL